MRKVWIWILFLGVSCLERPRVIYKVEKDRTVIFSHNLSFEEILQELGHPAIERRQIAVALLRETPAPRIPKAAQEIAARFAKLGLAGQIAFIQNLLVWRQKAKTVWPFVFRICQSSKQRRPFLPDIWEALARLDPKNIKALQLAGSVWITPHASFEDRQGVLKALEIFATHQPKALDYLVRGFPNCSQQEQREVLEILAAQGRKAGKYAPFIRNLAQEATIQKLPRRFFLWRVYYQITGVETEFVQELELALDKEQNPHALVELLYEVREAPKSIRTKLLLKVAVRYPHWRTNKNPDFISVCANALDALESLLRYSQVKSIFIQELLHYAEFRSEVLWTLVDFLEKHADKEVARALWEYCKKYHRQLELDTMEKIVRLLPEVQFPSDLLQALKKGRGQGD